MIAMSDDTETGGVEHDDVPELEFAFGPEQDIRAGEKFATVRYDSDTARSLEVGDAVDLVSFDGEEIDRVRVSGVADCRASTAAAVARAMGHRYPITGTVNLVTALNRYYADTIEPRTQVRVVSWEPLESEEADRNV